MKDKGLIINKEPRDIKERAFEFAVRVLKLTEYLSRNPINNTLVNQIIRSATSIGANIEEALGAHTKSDFAHCMNISKKEARETLYWLKMIREFNIGIAKRLGLLLMENEEIVKILTSIVKKTNARSFN